MAYRIRPRRNAAKEVRKAALDRISEAMRALALPAAERAEGVHQARKRFKELRALLRLVREPLGATFARENRCVRDLGRALAESREAAAMLESWDALAEAHHASSPAIRYSRRASVWPSEPSRSWAARSKRTSSRCCYDCANWPCG
ncbi:CHAD domain protein [Pseudomonas sp. BAY1663]|nr:CHAD domain protein [Pseudomonas sp. BAY1663]